MKSVILYALPVVAQVPVNTTEDLPHDLKAPLAEIGMLLATFSVLIASVKIKASGSGWLGALAIHETDSDTKRQAASLDHFTPMPVQLGDTPIMINFHAITSVRHGQSVKGCTPLSGQAAHLDGRTVFSARDKGTYSFDTETRERMLPFEGQAYYDGELDAWVWLWSGHSSHGRVCSCDVVEPASAGDDERRLQPPPAWKLAVRNYPAWHARGAGSHGSPRLLFTARKKSGEFEWFAFGI
ncbi:hypothetical protein E2562_016159 [Oryza meyeriana var. granulata]|uniref:Uncharacterized protein n=1 Tax=Oryza meyeriana var. granulata TaxID=110450 RepID=A0A6G1F8N4_9ORYZ|nr:hypothetical protein E2562_016159 [Oryza meyeriana var. granulata]